MDRATLDLFRNGDAMAVKAVYQEFGGPVFAVAYSILRDRDLAADASQQTFLKAWRAASDFDPERSLGPWIYAIARRTAIDIHRKRKRVHVSEDLDGEIRDGGLEAAWEAFEVRSALEKLPDDERVVIRLSHLEGLTHVEIAGQLGIPVGTVKSRSHRGHRRLAVLLDHLRDDER